MSLDAALQFHDSHHLFVLTLVGHHKGLRDVAHLHVGHHLGDILRELPHLELGVTGLGIHHQPLVVAGILVL